MKTVITGLRARGHRRVGPIPQHEEARHEIISSTTALIMGAIAAVAGLASAGIGIYSAVSGAKANAEMQDTQAEALEKEALSKEDTAAYEERQFRRKAAYLISKQHAIYGASGIDPSSGSPLMVELDTVRQAEMEAQNIRRGGAVGAASSRFESGLARYRSDYYRSTIAPTIAGGVMQGTGSVLSSWLRMSGSGK